MTTFAYPRRTAAHDAPLVHRSGVMTPNPLAFEKQMPIQKAYALLQFNNWMPPPSSMSIIAWWES